MTCVSSARHRHNGTQDFRGRVPRFLEDLEFGVDKTCAVLLAYNIYIYIGYVYIYTRYIFIFI